MADEQFLTKDEEQKVVDAIARAENKTSGEIRVHIENNCEKDDPLERAKAVFKELHMNRTELKIGVLVYVATDDKKVAVFGGQGIHEKVGQSFWDDVIALIIQHFKDQKFQVGLEQAIDRIGEKLKELFPVQEDDINELKDDISYNDNRDSQ